MKIIEKVRKLRETTGVGVMVARAALEETGGDLGQAKAWLKQRAIGQAAEKADRSTPEGRIFAYIHQTGKVASLVKLGCETDFVAKTAEFSTLGKEISMQVASMNPTDVAKLLAQPWIREGRKTVQQLVEELVAKVGENVRVLEIVRMEISA